MGATLLLLERGPTVRFSLALFVFFYGWLEILLWELDAVTSPIGIWHVFLPESSEDF